jgi:uncharacterized membrane protein YfcA
MLGGMVGNQGGIRSAALLGFDVPKKAFIATATAVGVIVDLARMSIYLLTDAASIASHWDYIAIASGGAIVGTLVGGPILHRIPESVFRRVIAIVLLILGAMMLFGIDR